MLPGLCRVAFEQPVHASSVLGFRLELWRRRFAVPSILGCFCSDLGPIQPAGISSTGKRSVTPGGCRGIVLLRTGTRHFEEVAMSRSVITLKDGSKRIFSEKTERVPDEGQFRPTKYAGCAPGDVIVWRDERIVKQYPLGTIAHLTRIPSETSVETVHIRCVTKDDDGTVTGFGGLNEDGRTRWYLLKQTAITGLGTKWDFHTTPPEGQSATVMAVVEASGQACLRTVRSDSREDDLDYLDPCPSKHKKETLPAASNPG